MATRQKLNVSKRTVTGKKVKKLRKEGLLPANVYGKGIASVSIQMPLKEFEALHKELGETGLLDVVMDGQLRPVLIKNVQIDHISRSPIHADFYQVNLKEKVKAMVPIEQIGVAKAVVDKVGIVLQPLSEVEVEALPTDLPEKIEVDVTHLSALDEQITISQLKIPAGVTILTDSEQVVVKVAELVTKEAQEEAAAAAAAAAAAKESAAEPAEGQPTEEGKEPAAQAEEKPKEPARNASQRDAGGEKPQEKKE